MTDDVDSVTPSGTALGLDDLTVDAFDDLERSLGRISLARPWMSLGQMVSLVVTIM